MLRFAELEQRRRIETTLQQPGLLPLYIIQAQMFVRGFGRHSSLRGTVEKAQLQQVRLDNIHNRVRFLADSG